MRGICPLFLVEDEICNSHIVPKFVYNSLKWGLNSRFIMYGEKSAPMQDGMKMPLLGKRAEVLFSRYENWFKEHIYPQLRYPNKFRSVKYDKQLYYFMVLQMWREAQYIVVKYGEDIFESQVYSLLSTALEEWRLFLTKGVPIQNYYHFYISPISSEVLKLPKFLEVELYLQRACDFNVMMGENNEIALYCKFPSFVIWTPLIQIEESFGYKILNGVGELDLRNQPTLSSNAQDYIRHRICEFAKNRANLARQRPWYIKKIQDKMDKDKEFEKSELSDILSLPTIPNFCIVLLFELLQRLF